MAAFGPNGQTRNAQRLPDRLLRDCRCRCCLTILVSGSGAGGGSGSDRPLTNLRSTPPSLDVAAPGLCPFALLAAFVAPVPPVPLAPLFPVVPLAPLFPVVPLSAPVEDLPAWADVFPPCAGFASLTPDPEPLFSDVGFPPAPPPLFPALLLPAPLLPALLLPALAPLFPALVGGFLFPDVPLPGFGLVVPLVSPAAGAGLPALPPIGTLPSGPIAAAPTGYLRSSTYCWPSVHRFVVTQYRTSPNCQYRPVSANSGMM